MSATDDPSQPTVEIELDLDDDLLERVDAAAAADGITRDEFFNRALKLFLLDNDA